MVTFREHGGSKEDHLFVEEDSARIYRGLKDVLVEELGMDIIEEGRMEFSVGDPEDDIEIHAYKEKSPYTAIRLDLSWNSAPVEGVQEMEREGVMKAEIETSSEVVTVYPKGNPLPWMGKPITRTPKVRVPDTHLDGGSDGFHDSKLYRIVAGIWYNIFYRQEVEGYEEEAEELVIHLHDLMRQKFGVESSISKSGASHYEPPWSG
ncbi:MAG: hypothetical protein ABEK01_01040 [Candidatus Nanohaloarchaea archaeon]